RRGRPVPSARNGPADPDTPTETTRIAAVTSRLPNSIQRCTSVWPVAPVAPMLCAVQAGQSGQPSPDWLSRTAAPVAMIAIEAITPASAHRRSATADGAVRLRAIPRAAADSGRGGRDEGGGAPGRALPGAEPVSTQPSLVPVRSPVVSRCGRAGR